MASVYQPLFPPVFDAAAVHESRATCDQCQMCDHGTVPAELSASYFHKNTKCCTYYPSLPNYLVGAVFADERAELDEGKRRLRGEIARRLGVHPQRLTPSKKWTLLYRHAMETSFGRSLLLRCPYMDEKDRCSIWYHRESICTTFYCKFDNGVAGSFFWKALKGYLAVVEEVLSKWSAKQVSSDVRDPRDHDTPNLTLAEFEDRPLDDETHRRFWGPWAGREEEFYVECNKRVRGLTREQFVKLVDETSLGRERLQQLEKGIEGVRAAPQLPVRASLNKKLRVLPVEGGVVLTMPYNNYDSIKIEPELFDVLKKFTHTETVAETRAKLEKDEGVELEDALISMFAMHDILVAPPKGGICDPRAAAPASLAIGRRCMKPEMFAFQKRLGRA